MIRAGTNNDMNLEQAVSNSKCSLRIRLPGEASVSLEVEVKSTDHAVDLQGPQQHQREPARERAAPAPRARPMADAMPQAAAAMDNVAAAMPNVAAAMRNVADVVAAPPPPPPPTPAQTSQPDVECLGEFDAEKPDPRIVRYIMEVYPEAVLTDGVWTMPNGDELDPVNVLLWKRMGVVYQPQPLL
jgi:hypothetical protein